MILKVHRYIVKKWIVLRMASQEFYFKQPFEIKDEYPIMKSILFFALVPIELIFIFLYARIVGSLSAYNLEIILAVAVVNLLVANLLINHIKDEAFIDETIRSYKQLDFETRKKSYSFKEGFTITFLMVVIPWLIFFIGMLTVCYLIPHYR